MNEENAVSHGNCYALYSVARTLKIMTESNTCTFGMFARSSDNDLIDRYGTPLYVNTIFYVVDILTAQSSNRNLRHRNAMRDFAHRATDQCKKFDFT